MASLQQMVEEFCSRAVLFSQPSANGSSTNSVKAHESFFDSFRRQPFAYEACLTVLDSFSARPTVPTTPQLPTAANCSSNSYSYCNSYINSNSERRKHPAAILAAQALVWITKKRSLTENEVNQLVQIVTSYSGDGVSGPVVPQLCLALGYCIVQLLSAMPPEEAEVLLLKVVQLFLSGGDSSCWCCIATLAAIAEAVSSNTSLIGLSAICSVLQLSGFVAHTLQLCLERSVSVVSNTEWLVLLLGTSSKWIQLIVEVAESSDGKGLTQLIHPLPTAWARSDLLQKARQWMLGVFSNGLCISDGQAELVSVITDTICALSRSFEILGHERIRNTSERLQLTSCIVAALEQTCSNTADTNLESLELSASTFSMAAVAGAVFSNEKPEMMRDICEYTAEVR